MAILAEFYQRPVHILVGLHLANSGKSAILGPSMRMRHVILAIIILAVLQILGAEWLYDTWLWFDIVMHFLGGVVAAVIAMALWDANVKSVALRTKKPLVRWAFFATCIVSFGAFVGVGWEWFEFIFSQLTDIPGAWGFGQPGLGDTMADLFCDILGAFSVTLFRRKV